MPLMVRIRSSVRFISGDLIRNDQYRLSVRNKFFLTILDRIKIARGKHLGLAGFDDSCSGNEHVANGWPQAIDREVGCQYLRPHYGSSRKSTGSINQSTDQARVQEARILAQLGFPSQRQFNLTFFGTSDLQSSPLVELSRRVNFLQ